MQAGASRPHARQTTILTFFSSQTDETDKENFRPPPFNLNKDSKEKGISLAAAPVKILALPQLGEAQKQPFGFEGTAQVTPQRHAQAAPASPPPLPGSGLLPAESHSPRETSCGAEEDSCCFSLTQDSEGNRIIAHRNRSGLLAGETLPEGGIVEREEAKTRLDFQPRLGASRNKKPHSSSSVDSLTDFSETENINPALTGDSTWAAGFYSSPRRAARAQPLRECGRSPGAASAEGREAGRSRPCSQLFTQDSEGNRVIAHRCRDAPPPPGGEGSAGRQLPDSPCGVRSGHAARSWSEAREQPLEVCYESLFTQDSEGNRVIKH
ncbi:aurora kinase A and ninein-interacting protein-like [Athene cunicularia]|uniref:aurora kinase A and ninein-interacting protein-like n=1 Tax=Athene cunicularia TaxID=194338 RepID=UPI000EF70769|nr:aurora kinase A and ninein-interacting protein-like [Athene cunicularia]